MTSGTITSLESVDIAIKMLIHGDLDNITITFFNTDLENDIIIERFIEKIIKSQHTIKSLTLGNFFSDISWNMILTALGNRLFSINTLILMPCITKTRTIQLLNAFPAETSVTKLIFNWMLIDEKSSAALINLIKTNTTITNITFYVSRFGSFSSHFISAVEMDTRPRGLYIRTVDTDLSNIELYRLQKAYRNTVLRHTSLYETMLGHISNAQRIYLQIP